MIVTPTLNLPIINQFERQQAVRFLNSRIAIASSPAKDDYKKLLNLVREPDLVLNKKTKLHLQEFVKKQVTNTEGKEDLANLQVLSNLLGAHQPETDEDPVQKPALTSNTPPAPAPAPDPAIPPAPAHPEKPDPLQVSPPGPADEKDPDEDEFVFLFPAAFDKKTGELLKDENKGPVATVKADCIIFTKGCTEVPIIKNGSFIRFGYHQQQAKFFITEASTGDSAFEIKNGSEKLRIYSKPLVRYILEKTGVAANTEFVIDPQPISIVNNGIGYPFLPRKGGPSNA